MRGSIDEQLFACDGLCVCLPESLRVPTICEREPNTRDDARKELPLELRDANRLKVAGLPRGRPSQENNYQCSKCSEGRRERDGVTGNNWTGDFELAKQNKRRKVASEGQYKEQQPMHEVLGAAPCRGGATRAERQRQLEGGFSAASDQIRCAASVLRNDLKILLRAAVAAQVTREAEFDAFAKLEFS